MANASRDVLPTDDIAEEHAIKNAIEHAISVKMTEGQRRVMAAAAEKEEQGRQSLWTNRADVLYHFFAYRYFDRSSACLDLLNFTDADIDSFDLTVNKARGLNNWHVYAEYLQKLDTPTAQTNTHRRKFIYHVRSFNKTQPAHFRFYLQNLTANDVEYVESLSKNENTTATGEAKQPAMLIWATSCVEDEIRNEAEEGDSKITGAVDHIEVTVKKCLADHRMKLRDNQSTQTMLNVEITQDELTKQLEQLAVNGDMRNGNEHKEDGSNAFLNANQ